MTINDAKRMTKRSLKSVSHLPPVSLVKEAKIDYVNDSRVLSQSTIILSAPAKYP